MSLQTSFLARARVSETRPDRASRLARCSTGPRRAEQGSSRRHYWLGAIFRQRPALRNRGSAQWRARVSNRRSISRNRTRTGQWLRKTELRAGMECANGPAFATSTNPLMRIRLSTRADPRFCNVLHRLTASHDARRCRCPRVNPAARARVSAKSARRKRPSKRVKPPSARSRARAPACVRTNAPRMAGILDTNPRESPFDCAQGDRPSTSSG